MREGSGPGPVIVPRPEHNVSRKDIDGEALKVLYRLHNAGFLACLVGGGVRDLLLGRKPKDFDVSTDAHPSQVKGLFRNSRIIGRRFRIVHVFFHDGRIVEVSTFRRRSEFTEGDGAEPEGENDLLLRRDNTFGTPEEDALRRDLTINGLFYDISSFSVIDYVGGLADLRAGIIRAIGDPDVRFQEDPVRMIRAVRQAARLGFRIEPATLDALLRHAPQIARCSTSRVLEELYRDLRGGSAAAAFRLFLDTGLLGALAPSLAAYLGASANEGAALSRRMMEALDREIQGGGEPPNSILMAALAGEFLLDVADGKFVPPPELEEFPGSAEQSDSDAPAGDAASPGEGGGEAEAARDLGPEAGPYPEDGAGGDPEGTVGPQFGIPVLEGAPMGVEPRAVLQSKQQGETGPAQRGDEPRLPTTDFGWILHHAWRPMARRLGFAKRDSENMIQILLAQPRLVQALRKGILPGRLRHKPHIGEAMTFFRLSAESRGEDVPQWLLELRDRPSDERTAVQAELGPRRGRSRGGGRFRGRKRRPGGGGGPPPGGDPERPPPS